MKTFNVLDSNTELQLVCFNISNFPIGVLLHLKMFPTSETESFNGRKYFI